MDEITLAGSAGALLGLLIVALGFLIIRRGQSPARATRAKRDELADLQRLHDAGEITDEEWAARRSAALGLGGGV